MTPFKIKKILIPLDFSPTSMKALDLGAYLGKLTNAEIILLNVIENIEVTTNLFFAGESALLENSPLLKINKMSNEGLNKASEIIKSKGIDKVKTISENGRTHKTIVSISKKIKADIIVMGTHGVSGFREFISGSNTYRVVSDSQCPVLSVQPKSKTTGFKNILVPFDDSPHARENVMYAIKMAEIFNANLFILGIASEQSKSQLKKIKLEGEQIKKISDKHNLKSELIFVSASFNDETIIKHSENFMCDLIIVASNILKQDITEYFKGNIAHQLVNHSTIPVLSVPSSYNSNLVELWQGI